MVDALGTVASLARFPVKSMLGESVPTVELTSVGVVGDRAYALIDTVTGKALSAKDPRVGTQLLACRAAFTEHFTVGHEMPPVRISLPDQTVVNSDDAEADSLLSAYLGVEVTLQRADQPGISSSLPARSFVDAFPLSVLSTSTLAHLHSLAPDSRFDPRRFRMNVIVDSPEVGFVEQQWLGRWIRIGPEARITVLIPDPRCVMTTLAQTDLPRDNRILQTLSRHNRLEVAGGVHPCAGVYASIDGPGSVREGDRLSPA